MYALTSEILVGIYMDIIQDKGKGELYFYYTMF